LLLSPFTGVAAAGEVAKDEKHLETVEKVDQISLH